MSFGVKLNFDASSKFKPIKLSWIDSVAATIFGEQFLCKKYSNLGCSIILNRDFLLVKTTLSLLSSSWFRTRC